MIYKRLQGLKYNKYNKSFKRIRLEKFNGLIGKILSHFVSSAEWEENEKTKEKREFHSGRCYAIHNIFINN